MQARCTGSDITHVAVVDDDESICRSFSRLLRVAGFQPVSYASAEALLEDTKRPRFDCLVLDIQLGGLSGLDLSQRLASVRDPTPVIFITAYDDPEGRAQALASGCAWVLSEERTRRSWDCRHRPGHPTPSRHCSVAPQQALRIPKHP
jgi:FixJ family two-component response regulator